MENVFEAVLSQINIMDVIQHYYSPKKIKPGKETLINPCPFCGGHKGNGRGGNNSFFVNAAKGVFRCHACDEGGNALDFVMKIKRLSNRYEAAKEINQTCGLKIDFAAFHSYGQNGAPPQAPEPDVDIRKKIFKTAATFFHQNLLKDAKALGILFKERKFEKAFLEGQPVGYSGNRRGILLTALEGKFSKEELLKSGLIAENDQSKLYEYFPPQYFIYFHIADNQVVNFSAKYAFKKKLKADDDRKRELYLKSEFRLQDYAPFNFNDLSGQEVIFVEGQNDALQIKRINEKSHVVADKNFTDEELLRRRLKHARMVYLWFDPDRAGDKYVRRFFEKFWGDFPVKVIGNGGGQGDPDEALRRHNDPMGYLSELKKKSQELFNWLLWHVVEEEEDRYTCLQNLRVFTEKFSRVKDEVLIANAIESIKSRFRDSSIARIISDNYKRELYTREASSASKKYLPYYEKEGIYFKRQGKGDIGLSNFVLRICDIVRMDEDIYYRCQLINDGGDTVEDVIFKPLARSNRHKFKEVCASKGAYYFTGNDSDLAGIWQFEEARQNLQKTFYIKHYGFIPADNMWLFENCAIDMKDHSVHEKDEEGFIHIGNYNYKSYDVLVYSGATPKLNLKDEYTKEFAQEVADKFHINLDINLKGELNSYKGYLLFGSLAATIYSKELYDRFGFFPFLFGYGPSGTGKTTMLQLLLECFGFSTSPESWPGCTEPGTYQFLQSLSSLPCWYDEFLNDKTFEKLLGTIKNVYNRTGSGKGGLDKRTVRQVNGSFWMSGEDNPGNEAILSRSVVFRFDPINVKKTNAYNWLVANRRKLSVITRQLILGKTEKSVQQFIEVSESIADYIIKNSRRMDFRVAMNHAIFAAGLSIMEIETPGQFYDYIVQHAEKGFQHKLTESPIYQFFSELTHLYNTSNLLDKCIKKNSEQNTLAVHFNTAIKFIQKELRTRGEELKIKPDSVKDYLADIDSCLEKSKKVYFSPGNFQRCLIFDLSQLPDNIKDMIEFAEKEDQN